MVSPPPDVGNKPAPAIASGTVAATSERGAAPPGAAAPALDRADIKPLDVQAALQILVAEVRESFTLLLIEASAVAAGPPGEGSNLALTANAAGVVNAAVAGDLGSAGAGVGVGAGEGVGAGVGAAAAAAGGGGGTGAALMPANLDSPAPAARALVGLVLQSLPETLDQNAWGAALTRVEAALQAGVQSAVDAVSAWRNVSSFVVETTKASAQLALQVLGEEPQNPLWLRPEWLPMAPRLTRFWRRRRAYRRRLSDPDYATAGKWDQTDEYTQ